MTPYYASLNRTIAEKECVIITALTLPLTHPTARSPAEATPGICGSKFGRLEMPRDSGHRAIKLIALASE